jgi:hypothetical protein
LLSNVGFIYVIDANTVEFGQRASKGIASAIIIEAQATVQVR